MVKSKIRAGSIGPQRLTLISHVRQTPTASRRCFIQKVTREGAATTTRSTAKMSTRQKWPTPSRGTRRGKLRRAASRVGTMNLRHHAKTMYVGLRWCGCALVEGPTVWILNNTQPPRLIIGQKRKKRYHRNLLKTLRWYLFSSLKTSPGF